MSQPDFDFDEGIKTDKQTGGASTTSGPSIPELEPSAVDFVLDVLEQKGSYELPAFARDADTIAEQYAEHYGFDADMTLSVQDLFDLEWSDTDYVGTEPLVENPNHPDVDDSGVTEEQLEQLTDGERTTSDGSPKKYVLDPEYAEQFRDANIDDSTLSALSRGINAYHSDDIVERWSDDHRVKVAIGKKRNNNSDAAQQREYVYFSTSDSETAAEKREEWAAEVNEE